MADQYGRTARKGGQRRQSGHTIKLTRNTYARTVLAADEIGQGADQFAEEAVLAALALHQRHLERQAYDMANRQALDAGRPTPLRSEYMPFVRRA